MVEQSAGIGSLLRERREELGQSIEDVHLRIRIHPDVILKLEQNNFSAIPGGPVYAKGFLKHYCDFLQLNTTEVLADFSSRIDKKDEIRIEAVKKPEVPKRNYLEEISKIGKKIIPYRKKIILLAVAVLGFYLSIRLIGIGIAITSDWINNYKENKQTRVDMNKSDVKKSSQNQVEQKTISAQQQAQSSVSVDVQPTIIAHTNTHEEAAKSPSTDVGGEWMHSIAQNNFPKISSKDPILLNINATTDVWLRVKSDGYIVYEAILKDGYSEKWVAEDNIEVKFGRPEGAVLSINGQQIGKPGNGKVKHILITKKGIQKIT